MNAYANYTDAQLKDLVKSGDDAAFTPIYNRYRKKLFTATVNKLGDLAEAEYHELLLPHNWGARL